MEMEETTSAAAPKYPRTQSTMRPPSQGDSRPKSFKTGTRQGTMQPGGGSRAAAGHAGRRNRHVAAGRSQFGGGMASVDMTIVQLANLKKQYVMESKQINAQRKRMKEIERNVAELKKQERGLGVKKAQARNAKLETHVQKMKLLVADETRGREQAEQDVQLLTGEVEKYSKMYEEICRKVEDLLAEKGLLERNITEKKKEFDFMIQEQEDRLKAVEEELDGLDKLLIRDNMVRNRISADKATVEGSLDKLKDLLAKEEDNIEADKDLLLKMIKDITTVEVDPEVRKRNSLSTICSSSSSADFNKFGRQSASSSAYLQAFCSNSVRPSRGSTSQMSAPRFSIVQARESYKAKRESVLIDGPPSFF